MAESVVSFVIDRVGPLLTEEAKFLWGVEKEVGSLKEELTRIRSFLKDADKKCKKNETLKKSLSEIRDKAYEAEDVIEWFIADGEQLQQRKKLPLKCIAYLKRPLTIHRVGKQILDIKGSFPLILERMKTSTELEESLNNPVVSEEKEKRAPVVEENDVVGFSKEAEEIKKLLTQARGRRAAVPIVGAGGSGKTTLTKLVYNSSQIKKHFKYRAWIYVSKECRVRDLLRELMEKITKDVRKRDLSNMKEEDLREMLLDYLKTKRYLVVIDDIWKKEVWDALISALPDEATMESRVVLTTRHRDVASHADKVIQPYDIKELDAKEGWELFSKTANCPPELEELGKSIVAKCGGLPLAIEVLGGLCRKDKTPSKWTRLLEDASWHDQDRCVNAFALSYSDLPYYLKPCFLYFCLFPEVSSIKADRIIQLWVAEGFVQKKDGKKTLEDVAQDYLDQLIDKSMIQVATHRSDGGVESCRIQDVLREIALKEAKQDNFLNITGDEDPLSCRLAIHSHVADLNLSNNIVGLRSLLCFSGSQGTGLWKSISDGGSIKKLRVLDLEGACIRDLPDTIGELVLLKYLGLLGTKIDKLPSSAGNLLHLQTLDLRYTNILDLPSWVWKMRRLRRVYLLDINVTCSTSRPPRIDRLRDLDTLELKTGDWIRGGLNKLTNLKKFSTIGEVSTRYREALSDALAKLTSLRSLYLEEKNKEVPMFLPLPTSFARHENLFQLTLVGRIKKLPNHHEFPPNLRDLKLSNSHLKKQDYAPQMMEILEKLPMLKKLVLEQGAYEGKDIVCSAGGFSKLQCLTLAFLDNFEEWRMEEGTMPRLESLYLANCMRLKMIPDWLRHITTLQDLIVIGMAPQFNSRIAENEGEDWFKIKDIPSISIYN